MIKSGISEGAVLLLLIYSLNAVAFLSRICH